MRMNVLLPVLTGVALALPYLAYARRMRDPRRAFGAGLAVAALVYAGFALAAGTSRDLLVESIGVVLFGAVAFLGIRGSSWLLALGWAAHVSWDLLLHPRSAASYAPWWYPATCIGFDLVVAVAILGASRRPLRES